MLKKTVTKIVILAILFFSNAQALENFEHKEPLPVPDVGFLDGQGNIHTLNEYDGKVILLNFWATWCIPCVHEMPAFDNLQKKLNEKNADIVVVPISLDKKDADTIKKFYKKHDITELPIYFDDAGKVYSANRIQALPSTLIINRSKKEISRILGELPWDSDEIVEYLIAIKN